ncbi:hypothetical protein G7Y79_00040g077060 [Physcia stellaris]|nr:hypothetical protein G7Y79_00040g077060 [Physcia stellaris]
MLPSGCDECKPEGRRGLPSPTSFLFSSLPFLATFFLVFIVALRTAFPFLSRESALKRSDTDKHAAATARPVAKRLSGLTFSTTIALATILIELILCEISNTVDPEARGLALRTTVALLLFLLVVALPALEIQSVISAAGYEFIGIHRGSLRLAWVFQILITTAWLLVFWWSRPAQPPNSQQSFSEACLERVGVIGISFMALLSGFASVSAPWQNFFTRQRLVSEIDLTRKETGLAATQDMLVAKQSRLRALKRKLADRPSESYFQKALGTIRPNAEANEHRTLELETKGLEAMALSLSTSHDILRTRYTQQQRSKSATGRVCLSLSYGFSLFCLYRVFSIAFSAFRRYVIQSKSPNTGSDPVTTFLALLAKHYDPSLDQAAWSRQISLLLSFLILFASFSSVLQTLRLTTTLLPSLSHLFSSTLHSNLPLIVAQLCGTYVISATLMLRGMIPGSVIGEGVKQLGGGQLSWIDAWFEAWFLGGVGVTVGVVWVGRRLRGEGWEGEDWGNEGDDVERGQKRS